MKTVSLAVCLVLAASVGAQEPFVKDFGPRSSVDPRWHPNGVYQGNKRVAIVVTQPPFAPETYYQPFDWLVPAGNRFTQPGGIWYPVRINYWTDGRPWVQTWRYVSTVETTYQLRDYGPVVP